MPRPVFRRNKLNRPRSHSHSTSHSHSRSRRATTAHPTSPQLPRVQVEIESKLPHKPLGTRHFDSDDSDRLVTKRVSRRRHGGPPREVYASGGVRGGDVPMSHRSEKAERQKRANMARQAHEVRHGLESASTQSTPGVRPSTSVPIVRPARPSTDAVAPEALAINSQERQSSMLRQVDHAAPRLDVEDEQEFVPDDESTPRHPTNLTSTAKSSFSSRHPKRKFSDFALSQSRATPAQDGRTSDRLNHAISIEPRLPAQKSHTRPTNRQRHDGTPIHEDKVMAPPQSSSPLSSPARAPEPSLVPSKRSQRRPAPPTTAALQALMPSKRKTSLRPNKQATSEFDIPADSEETSSSQSSDEHEHSTFQPRQKRRPSAVQEQSKGAATTKEKQKMLTHARWKANVGKKGTKARAARAGTISPLTKRATPLRSNARARTSTKSPLQNIVTMSTSNRGATAKPSAVERYVEAEADKENRRAPLWPRSSRRDGGRDNASSEGHPAADVAETQAIRDKFAAIDDWDMDFEEVSVGSDE